MNFQVMTSSVTNDQTNQPTNKQTRRSKYLPVEVININQQRLVFDVILQAKQTLQKVQKRTAP